MTCSVRGGRLLCVLLATALPCSVYAQTAPAKPPEVAKTVDAFVGRWSLKGTDREPGGAEPAPVTATFDCKPAALGAAVDCHIEAEVQGERVEAAAVIGFSPDEHVVRWMEISSTGEYHDHKGTWQGNELAFEPLQYSVAGEKATENLSVAFPSSGRMTLKSTTRTAAGDSVLLLDGIRDANASK